MNAVKFLVSLIYFKLIYTLDTTECADVSDVNKGVLNLNWSVPNLSLPTILQTLRIL